MELCIPPGTWYGALAKYIGSRRWYVSRALMLRRSVVCGPGPATPGVGGWEDARPVECQGWRGWPRISPMRESCSLMLALYAATFSLSCEHVAQQGSVMDNTYHEAMKAREDRGEPRRGYCAVMQSRQLRPRRVTGAQAGREAWWRKRGIELAHPVARHSDVIDADAPASSLAALDPSRGTLCGGGGTFCKSRLRVLRRISGGGGQVRRERNCGEYVRP